MLIHHCALNASIGDEIEFDSPLSGHKRYPVIGRYTVRGIVDCVVVGTNNADSAISLYYSIAILPTDMVVLYKYCCPIHIDYVGYEIKKVYKKKR